MFHVKINTDKPANGLFPNQSHLHRMTTSPGTAGSHIPRKQSALSSVKTSAHGDVDVAVDSSIVSNFLKTMAARENGTTVQGTNRQGGSNAGLNRMVGSKENGLSGSQNHSYRTAGAKENGTAPNSNISNISHLHRTTRENGFAAGNLYKTQATIKEPGTQYGLKKVNTINGNETVSQFGLKKISIASEPITNQFGLKKMSSAVETVGLPSQLGLKKVDVNTRKEDGLTRTRSDPEQCKEVRVADVGYGKGTVLEDGARWKTKYEDAEKRRKEMLMDSQKAMREKTSLEKQLQKLQTDYQDLNTVCNDRTQQLDKLRKVSEQVYQDYDKLNMKYETETTTLHKALEVASKWYKENKKLKRESVALRSGAKLQGLDDVVDGEPEVEEQHDELEELRHNVQDLSSQVGQLQSELNRARLQEFEAQEQFINLTQALDEERCEKERLKMELRELQIMKEKFESVTYMVKDEMNALRTERDRATESATRLQEQAHQAVKERNVLAHQSSMLMGDLTSDEKLYKAFQEMEELKRKLEEETQRHGLEMEAMERRLEEKESEAQMELMEEKLKLAESELQLALQRAETAEKSRNVLNSKVNELESQLGGPSSGGVPPPPPPPLPPPMPFLDNTTSTKIQRPVKRACADGDSLEDMANLLGIQRQPKTTNVQGGAIDDLINEIKGGKFILKATEVLPAVLGSVEYKYDSTFRFGFRNKS